MPRRPHPRLWYDPVRLDFILDDYADFDPVVPEVDVTDDGVIGTLLGPDGATLVEVRRPIGFVRR